MTMAISNRRNKITIFFSLLSSTFSYANYMPDRNGYNNRKIRRHANDGSSSSHQKSLLQRRQHPLTYSSSQLSIEVSKLHAGANGRLEITCLATIPAQIGIDEEYADYKTHSVKGKSSFKF